MRPILHEKGSQERLPRPNALASYLVARPAHASDAARLAFGFGVSVLTKLVSPSRFTSVGTLLPGKSPVTVSLAGFEASVRPGTNDLDLLLNHEPRTMRWMHVGPGEVLVDVGAHIGRYTLRAATSASLVVAIEPDPENFVALANNVGMNRFENVLLIHQAMSDHAGVQRLHLAGGQNRGTSSLEAGWKMNGEVGSRRAVEVKCNTIDDALRSLKLDRIDWLKVDVEGHEEQVLEGARETLSRTRRLVLEVSRGHADRCRALTGALGFELVDQEGDADATNWLMERRK
jgi:FkbM family methyltransferase